MPSAPGSPRWIGAPCIVGKRALMSVARSASAGEKGRIETTRAPPKGPTASVAVGAIHRDVALLLDVAQRHAGVAQRVLEREGAADDEGYKVLPPERCNLLRLLCEL